MMKSKYTTPEIEVTALLAEVILSESENLGFNLDDLTDGTFF